MNALDAGSLSLGAALIAGFAGSGHCLSMCGGIAGALAMRNSTAEGGGSRLALALAYNLARVASYTLAGALAGGAKRRRRIAPNATLCSRRRSSSSRAS